METVFSGCPGRGQGERTRSSEHSLQACGGWEGGHREGRTERGRVRATHIETRFHEGVEVRPWPIGWAALSTEIPQSFRVRSACFGLPHTLQVRPPVVDHALQHLCPSVLRKVAGEPGRLANSRRAQYFPEFRCSFCVWWRRFVDPERVGGLRDYGGGPRRLRLGLGDLHSRSTAEQEACIEAQAVGHHHGVQQASATTAKFAQSTFGEERRDNAGRNLHRNPSTSKIARFIVRPLLRRKRCFRC